MTSIAPYATVATMNHETLKPARTLEFYMDSKATVKHDLGSIMKQKAERYQPKQ